MKVLERVLTPQQQELLPTEKDIIFYEEHGWYISPPIIPDEVIDRAIELLFGIMNLSRCKIKNYGI